MAQYRTFFLPLAEDGEAQDTLNAFLRSKRVLSVERVFAQTGWAFCVEWLEGGRDAARNPPKVDYREALNPKDFEVFSRLRNKRKELAERDGVQVYTVMTNEQLAEMIRLGATGLEDLRKIEGIGDVRIAKYGAAFLSEIAAGPVAQANNETGVVVGESMESIPSKRMEGAGQ